MKHISIILPAYNEEASIAQVLENIKKLPISDFEIIVVNDGSTDETTRIAALYADRVLHHHFRRGNGAAVRTGLESAVGDIVVIIDADGQHDSAEIPRMIEMLKDCDMVVGERTGGSFSMRTLANGIYNWLTSSLFEYPVKDLTSGFRAFFRSKMEPYYYLIPNGFSFPTTSTLTFIQCGYRVLFMPIRQHDREKGTKSKINPMKDGLKFFLIILRILMFYQPVRVFLPVCAVLFLCGFIWSIKTLLSTHQFSAGGLLMIISSLIIFFFSIMADQIILIRKQNDYIHKKK